MLAGFLYPVFSLRRTPDTILRCYETLFYFAELFNSFWTSSGIDEVEISAMLKRF
jgi:hypothetical protein